VVNAHTRQGRGRQIVLEEELPLRAVIELDAD
jgi:hypothetical protein